MYADNTLTPKEAVRLCALGTLAQESSTYGNLANSIRHFVSRILGPSLDVMGPSLELLKFEGLVEVTGDKQDTENQILTITDAGREEFSNLMTASVRTAAAELNKLIITLKFRFLHLLERNDQILQTELLIDFWENEIARLVDLRSHHANNDGHLTEWLDHDIQSIEGRLTWLQNFSSKI